MVGASAHAASCEELDADPNIPDTLGIRPLTYAAGNGHDEVLLERRDPCRGFSRRRACKIQGAGEIANSISLRFRSISALYISQSPSLIIMVSFLPKTPPSPLKK